MSGRGGRSSYHDGKGNGDIRGRCRGQGHNYYGKSSTDKRGLCNSLGTNDGCINDGAPIVVDDVLRNELGCMDRFNKVNSYFIF